MRWIGCTIAKLGSTNLPFRTSSFARKMATANGPIEETGDTKVKSAKTLEKERKQAEKQKKFEEKKAKLGDMTGSNVSKTKEKKVKQAEAKPEDVLSPYQESTPPGEKKSILYYDTIVC